MKPSIRPRTAKPASNTAPTCTDANRAASAASSRRGCDVSRISMTRRCSSRSRRNGSEANVSCVRVSGLNDANRLFAAITEAIRSRWGLKRAMKKLSSPTTSRRDSRLGPINASGRSPAGFWKSTAAFVSNTSMSTVARRDWDSVPVCIDRGSTSAACFGSRAMSRLERERLVRPPVTDAADAHRAMRVSRKTGALLGHVKSSRPQSGVIEIKGSCGSCNRLWHSLTAGS